MRRFVPALIVHGGAGGRAPADHLPGRRRALLAAVEAGGRILRKDGDALDAIIAAVAVLEDDPLFNAGYGSFLTTEGTVEMDAGVAVARRTAGSGTNRFKLSAGGVVLVSRVRNPIRLARAVMEYTPHMLMGGAAAERLAGEAGLRLCRPESLISPRARERWRTIVRLEGSQDKSGGRKSLRDEVAQAKLPRAKDVMPGRDSHGTVGAVAVDASGNLAAGTSTGGVVSQLPGRIGDSGIFGAGLFANGRAVASATGEGEAILATTLCRSAIERMGRQPPDAAAVAAIARFAESTGRDAGIIMIDCRGRFGYAHNADAMEVATYHPRTGLQHFAVPNLARSRRDWPPK